MESPFLCDELCNAFCNYVCVFSYKEKQYVCFCFFIESWTRSSTFQTTYSHYLVVLFISHICPSLTHLLYLIKDLDESMIDLRNSNFSIETKLECCNMYW